MKKVLLVLMCLGLSSCYSPRYALREEIDYVNQRLDHHLEAIDDLERSVRALERAEIQYRVDVGIIEKERQLEYKRLSHLSAEEVDNEFQKMLKELTTYNTGYFTIKESEVVK